MRMQDLASEAAGIARPVRLPVMAVGDDEPIIEAELLFAFDLDAPPPPDPLSRHDARIEGYAVIERKLARIGAEVLLRLGAAHVVRPLIGEGEIRITRQFLRRVEIGRAVDRVRIVRVPDAANIGERLKAVEGDAALGEGLGDREPASAGANDAIPLHHFSAQNDAPSGRASPPAVDSTEAAGGLPCSRGLG